MKMIFEVEWDGIDTSRVGEATQAIGDLILDQPSVVSVNGRFQQQHGGRDMCVICQNPISWRDGRWRHDDSDLPAVFLAHHQVVETAKEGTPV